MSEVAVFIERMIRFKHGVGYLYAWLATVALYGGWYALYSTLTFFGGPLAPYAWLSWIPVVAIVAVSVTYTYRKLELSTETDPVLSETTRLRGKIFGSCFGTAYLLAGVVAAAGLPPKTVLSIAWIPALSVSWILVGLFVESKEVEKGYLPQRISLQIGALTAVSFTASLTAATLLHPLKSSEWYWTFHGLMCFTLIFTTVLSFITYASKVTEVDWLVRNTKNS
ncbi:MAG: hypothetical protein DRJ63_10095 [Thermoprotei archaeon]|nr:MAG: hypothetical protein DRJ63_10095 [Thermoprotei archaeon]